MKFLIIGAGNLGWDLKEELERRDLDFRFITVKDCAYHPLEFQPDIMIYTPGGSITDPWPTLHKKIFEGMLYYGQRYNPVHTFFFSSNAAMQPEQNAYAFAKKTAEASLGNDNRGHAIRVSSLYGTHKPERCFPNKLLMQYNGSRWPEFLNRGLPENPIVPTPTKWLAEKVIDYIFAGDYRKVISIAPHGETTPLEWGKLILGDRYEVRSAGISIDRPSVSFVSDVYFEESWLDLWKRFGPSQIGKSLSE